jgi:large subunit ribosomal protein L17
MRHRTKGRKFNRTTEHRHAMMRNMATSLFLHGRVETTTEKAKELRQYAEPLITKAKRGDLHSRRVVARKIQDSQALKRLFEEIGPRFAERPGGYTRVLHLGHRPGDAADMSIIELVD